MIKQKDPVFNPQPGLKKLVKREHRSMDNLNCVSILLSYNIHHFIKQLYKEIFTEMVYDISVAACSGATVT